MAVGNAATFTGRTRPRRTRGSVRAVDRAARWIITVGGAGTIAAVLLVCVFLAFTAAPLLTTASLSADGSAEPPATESPLAGGIDNTRTLGWECHADGTLRLIAIREGRELERRELVKGCKITAVNQAPGSDEIALGLDDGSCATVQIRLESQVLTAEQASELLPKVPSGGVAFDSGRALQSVTGGALRQTELVSKLSEPLRGSSGAAVRAVDHATSRNGPVFLTVDEQGRASVVRQRQRRGLQRPGRSSAQATETTLEIPADGPKGPPRFAMLSGLGDQALLAWDDGTLLRYQLAAAAATLVERLDLLDHPQARLTALVPLIGRSTWIAGDSRGGIRAWFVSRVPTVDGEVTRLRMAHELQAKGSGVTSLCASPLKRMVAAGSEDGTLRVFHVTTRQRLAEWRMPKSEPILQVAFSSSLDGLAARQQSGLHSLAFDPAYPEITWASLYSPIWYESYPAPAHVWQSSGGSGYEPKLGFVPLVFGTLKATFFTMLLAVPLAILGAIYSSEFLHRDTRARIKPVIEMMASLPSVVLGFLAALVLGPFVERVIPAIIVGVYILPLLFTSAAFAWQLLPQRIGLRFARWRFAGMFLLLPLGFWLIRLAAPWAEHWTLAGDARLWLDGQAGRATGGWFWILLAPASVFMALACSWWINPWLRRIGHSWTYGRFAAINALKYLACLALSVGLAAALAWLLDVAGFDPRGPLLGTYVARNALIVGFVMGFAVIPIIYTLAEDALATVPDHLRSASLGAGATPWQTAVRVVIPTAASGLFSAVMVGLGRAVGETMIVLMAGGNTAILDVNPFNGMRTLSAAIATELPEAAKGSTEYRVLFLAALILFLMTFALNTLAEWVRQRFRRRAVQL